MISSGSSLHTVGGTAGAAHDPLLPIGASRHLASFQPANNSLSFFSNNILGSKPVLPITQPHTQQTGVCMCVCVCVCVVVCVFKQVFSISSGLNLSYPLHNYTWQRGVCVCVCVCNGVCFQASFFNIFWPELVLPFYTTTHGREGCVCVCVYLCVYVSAKNNHACSNYVLALKPIIPVTQPHTQETGVCVCLCVSWCVCFECLCVHLPATVILN